MHGVHAFEKEKPHFGHLWLVPLAVHLPDTFSENNKGFYSSVLRTGLRVRDWASCITKIEAVEVATPCRIILSEI